MMNGPFVMEQDRQLNRLPGKQNEQSPEKRVQAL